MADKVSDKHNHNPDVRPTAQQIRERKEYAGTPPVPRPFPTAFSKEFLKDYHAGVMKYTYKGVSCLKSPIDLAVYMLLIHDLRPGAIIEIGSFHGGAALFYADLCQNYALEAEVITLDFRTLGANDAEKLDPRVGFIQADAADLESSDLHARLDDLPHPWLVIEDSAHTRDVSFAVMEYFGARMTAGDYLIIEDGVIEDQGGAWRYGGGPNLAVHDYFVAHPDQFEIDERYNDFFGRNASFNPNGYLRKT